MLWSSLVPLVIGVVCALTVGRSRLFHEYICLVGGASCSLLVLWQVWYVAYVDRGWLMIRNPLWRVVDLERLVLVAAFPGGPNGPVLRVVDQSGAKCLVAKTNLSRHDWAVVCQALQPYANRESVKHEGPVRKILSRPEASGTVRRT